MHALMATGEGPTPETGEEIAVCHLKTFSVFEHKQSNLQSGGERSLHLLLLTIVQLELLLRAKRPQWPLRDKPSGQDVCHSTTNEAIIAQCMEKNHQEKIIHLTNVHGYNSIYL